jgi:hypothetical protein
MHIFTTEVLAVVLKRREVKLNECECLVAKQ